jgi:hypothetical protein
VEETNVPETLGEVVSNVFPVWGLMRDECLSIFVFVQELIDQGRASDVSMAPKGTYVCVYDRLGAPYTVGRERRIMHLLGPDGEAVAFSKDLETIIDALDATLQRH